MTRLDAVFLTFIAFVLGFLLAVGIVATERHFNPPKPTCSCDCNNGLPAAEIKPLTETEFADFQRFLRQRNLPPAVILQSPPDAPALPAKPLGESTGDSDSPEKKPKKLFPLIKPKTGDSDEK